MAGDEDVGPETSGSQARFGAREFERVDVQTDQAPARLQAFKEGLRMPATAKRAINGNLTGPRSKAAEHLIDHDRSMRPRRRPAGGENLLYVRRVALRVQLFVLVVELPRVPARVPAAPRVVRPRAHQRGFPAFRKSQRASKA